MFETLRERENVRAYGEAERGREMEGVEEEQENSPNGFQAYLLKKRLVLNALKAANTLKHSYKSSSRLHVFHRKYHSIMISLTWLIHNSERLLFLGLDIQDLLGHMKM